MKTNCFIAMKKSDVSGKDWIADFMSCFSLNLRAPEQTSVARLAAFNKPVVTKFFNVSGELRNKFKFKASQIYNLDETGLSTVPTKTSKVIAPIGLSRVSKVSSAERGILTTVVCCINAIGQFLPPFFIFPKQRMNPNYLKNAPAESDGVAYESGWITKENFTKYLKHFVKYVRPSESFPVLLIMDNHRSHVSLEAINFCREHHITVLGIPSHTSGHLQPLDVGVYAPLKVVYSSACNSFLTGNPGKMIRIDDVAGIFKNAYEKIATSENAMKGFKATGIEPFNPNIFSDGDFKAALVTERPDPTQSTQQTSDSSLNSLNVSSIAADTLLSDNVQSADNAPSSSNHPPTDAIDIQSASANNLQLSMTTPLSTLNCTYSIENELEVTNEYLATSSPLPAMPHASRPTPKFKRKKLPSLILSSTPVKHELEEKENAKAEKLAKKKAREEKRKIKLKEMEEQKVKKLLKQKVHEKNREEKLKTKKKRNAAEEVPKNRRKRARHVSESEESSSEEEFPVLMDSEFSEEEDLDELCIICEERGKDEEWYKCGGCGRWAHALCSGWSKKEIEESTYRCDLCHSRDKKNVNKKLRF